MLIHVVLQITKYSILRSCELHTIMYTILCITVRTYVCSFHYTYALMYWEVHVIYVLYM